MISINGKTYRGNNISIINNEVFIDGKKQENAYEKTLTINTESLINIKCDESVSVHGSVESIESGGSVSCDDVGGNIKSGGSVNCDDVGGNVSARGSVNCDEVRGRII